MTKTKTLRSCCKWKETFQNSRHRHHYAMTIITLRGGRKADMKKTTNIVNPTHLLAKKTSTDVTIIIFNCRNSSRRNNRTITTITLSSSWAIHRHTLSTLTRLWYRIFLLIPNIYVSHIGTALSLKTRAFTEYTAVHSLPFG